MNEVTPCEMDPITACDEAQTCSRFKCSSTSQIVLPSWSGPPLAAVFGHSHGL
ncbi:hypothetical protein M404DRAFT_1002499 [Pisolithus tinctorius Marx 270]|uniref:Uncharacterized protein n=1 Tax=Pisolithus tinctorius Marx 270 TaxID=870435 RepID=A0A0C3IZ33_PISTI|nr:hypothetical protein M404DRAFT_1002499 [Pisolithus tinctorius Marx 270]